MRKFVAFLAVTACLASFAATAAALEVGLTVPERAGLDRVDNHVSGGVPLPEGAYKDVDKFVLVDADGKAVPAQFVVRERWPKDDSVRHMTVHFTADLKAGAAAKYTVKDSGGAPAPTKPAAATEAADSVAVDTGAVKFTVKKGDWHLFDSVEAGGKALLKSPGRTVFRAEYGKTPVAKEIATPPALGTPTAATAVVKELAVEEKGPGRVVVLAKGSFQEGGADKLDFQARYYAMAGSPSVRVAFTVINRQGQAFDEFVGLRELGFELPLALGGDAEKKFALGASEGEDLAGALGGGEKVALVQPSSLEYAVSGKAEGRGKCRELLTKRVGWISLAGTDAAATAAVRWFWQLHPKGLEAAGDGTLKVWIVPFQEKPAEVPAGEFSEPRARIDLYTGGARTHEMLFAFHAPAGAADARARSAGVLEPLLAACAPEWYCQKTLAFDRMYDARLENYRPEVRELVKRYEQGVDAGFARVMMRLDGKGKKNVRIAAFHPIEGKDKDGKALDEVWCSDQKLEEYGWLNYGSHCEHNTLTKQNDALNTRWDGNYYDFPRACLIRFLRTGMWQYLDAAEAAGLHLADVDITHWHPGDQKLNGIERMCPNTGHFRTWSGGQVFRPSGNVDSAKSQSLFELYCLTGDAWYREAGLLSGDYLVVHGGSALRAQGNRMTGLYAAWKSAREQKYRDAWEKQVKATAAMGIARGGDKGWDQFWMYGLAAEGLYKYARLTGDADAAKAAVLAADSLTHCDVSKAMGGSKRSEYDNLAGFTVPCWGYAYELTGDAKYLAFGLKRLEITARSGPGRSKTFAQHSRISPQFLYYLAADYQPPKPVVGEKAAADPVEPVLKEYAAGATGAAGEDKTEK